MTKLFESESAAMTVTLYIPLLTVLYVRFIGFYQDLHAAKWNEWDDGGVPNRVFIHTQVKELLWQCSSLKCFRIEQLDPLALCIDIHDDIDPRSKWHIAHLKVTVMITSTP